MTVTAETFAVVTWPKGGWKYQDAYRVARYTPHVTRDGRTVYRNAGYVTGKLSLPQVRRYGYGHLPVGGLHNRPVN